MSLARSEARKIIMTILYQISLYQEKNISYNLDNVINENLTEDDEFVNSVVKGVIDNIDQIDTLANKYLSGWTLKRLGYTDQAIIRLSIYELMYTDTPSKVCIDEAIELAKQYSDDSVVKMINGILDKIYHNEVKHD